MADLSRLIRFQSKVDARGDDECWPWTAKARTQFGYGVFRLSKDEGVIGAHRFAFMAAGNEIPDGTLVRHKCDNPICCNPAHLVLGTPQDNVTDMIERGRKVSTGSPGIRNGRAVLTVADVASIRSSGLTSTKVAERWGISRGHAHRVLVGTAWGKAA